MGRSGMGHKQHAGVEEDMTVSEELEVKSMQRLSSSATVSDPLCHEA